jgi:hypothetical protein
MYLDLVIENNPTYIEVFNSVSSIDLIVGGSTTGGGTWGSITGDLEDQTDLYGVLNSKAERSTEKVSGGDLSIVGTTMTISPTEWFIKNFGEFTKATPTDFANIQLSAAGTQRFVAFFGDTSGDVVKVEGNESAFAIMPTLANAALLNFSLVTDAAIGSGQTGDLSGYLQKSEKATAGDIVTGTNDTLYITSKGLKDSGIVPNPRATTVTSTASVTIDCSTTDQYELTALATNVTINAPLNPVNCIVKLLVYRDNGTARTITRDAIFTDITGIAPTTTTANKVGMELYRYSSARSRWEIITVITQP